MRSQSDHEQPTPYETFLATKRRDWTGVGFDPPALPTDLYPFQDRLTRWACRKGRAALWADTGLGKTRMQVAWASTIPGRVLILAPLCVAPQTIGEAARIGVKVGAFGTGATGATIEITNYERLHHVTPADYAGVVLDESSILKSFDGKTRTRLIGMFQDTPYRLCCTATPAPNDIAELANHCEFLGIMTRAEMLATFFVHDEDGWRLKGHAHEAFYRWLATWGMFLRRPSDLGFDDTGYLLPPVVIEDRVVQVDAPAGGEFLFQGMGLGGIKGRLGARRGSLEARVEAAVRVVRDTPGAWLVWCGLNPEQDLFAKALGEDCVSVAGADSEQAKQDRIMAFVDGRARVLVSKVAIAGFGLNFQHCHQMLFLGLGDSYEQYYQAIRRCYRFGQRESVRVVVIVSSAETEIVTNVRRKEQDAATVASELIRHMADEEKKELGMATRQRDDFTPDVATGDAWTLHLGDAVEGLRAQPSESVDFSVYSPPFLALYTYSNSERDLGNCSTREEFLDHYRYVVREVLRTTKAGRITAVHCADVGTTKAEHGVIGLHDLPGDIIRLYQAEGWIYHGRVTIDKNPQAQAIRTHSKSLLFVQLRKDSSWMRPAIADYICLFRKPGDNPVPVKPDGVSNEDWILWAHPIWYGISESDTLNVRAGRANDDDRHICPLQLGTIERCVRLWSNPGELVLSPFAGIGSEGYESVRLGRRFLGYELKREYWEAAKTNLATVERSILAQGSLFQSPSEA